MVQDSVFYDGGRNVHGRSVRGVQWTSIHGRRSRALLVGFTVGLTGMGGGALMTPILVLVFGVEPRHRGVERPRRVARDEAGRRRRCTSAAAPSTGRWSSGCASARSRPRSPACSCSTRSARRRASQKHDQDAARLGPARGRGVDHRQGAARSPASAAPGARPARRSTHDRAVKRAADGADRPGSAASSSA